MVARPLGLRQHAVVESAGTLQAIWRYPVKSMAGESLSAADVGPGGIVGDRLWAVRDDSKGALTNGKKLPALMTFAARYLEQPSGDAVPHVAITLPDGSEVRSDDPAVHARLSAALGRQVTLCARRPAEDRAHYRAGKLSAGDMRHDFALGPNDPLPDFSMFPVAMLAELARYATPPGTYFDAYTLHVLTTSSLAAIGVHAPGVDPRRFRPNLLIDTGASADFTEVSWCGGVLRAGGLTAALDIPTVRCSMPSRAQPGLPADPAVLSAVIEHANRCLGVYGSVTIPGRITVGDRVRVAPRRPSSLRTWAESRATSLKRLVLKAVAAGLPKQ